MQPSTLLQHASFEGKDPSRSSIPSLLVTGFGWAAPAVQAIAAADPAFGPFILDANHLQYHLIGLSIALRLGDRGISPHHLAALGPLLRQRKVAVVVRTIRGTCPPGLASALWKLPPQLLPQRHYEMLFTLLGEPAAAKVLWHAERISPLLLRVLKRLEPTLHRPAFVALFRSVDEVKHLEWIVASIERILSGVDRGALLKQLATARSNKELSGAIRALLAQVALPPPPFAGTELLRPLRTLGEVHQIGREFQNCLVGPFINPEGSNRRYYVWRGNDPAVVLISTDDALGWCISEILGPNNQPVPPETIRQIVRTLGKAGIRGWHSMRTDLGIDRFLNG